MCISDHWLQRNAADEDNKKNDNGNSGNDNDNSNFNDDSNHNHNDDDDKVFFYSSRKHPHWNIPKNNNNDNR